MSPSLYTRLAAGLVFPLHEGLKGHSTVKVRRALEQSQWWSAEQLRDLQMGRLRDLLEHAAAEVPYYRELLQRLQLNPADFQQLADLQQLPFLTKPLIRANEEALKSSRAQGLSRFNTGGSSGEPLIFFIGKERVSHDVAAKWRATRWWGVDIGDPEIVIWGSPIELGTQDRLRALRDKLLRTRLLAAFEMSESKLDSFIDTIRNTRPRMLFGYPSALAHIAERAAQQGQRMDKLGIRVAFVTSERLYDHQRELIETVFGCPVANGYGGRDAGFIAHACLEGNMHITAEDIIVEIVDPEGQVLPPGQAGEIVVTHLATRDYPFIRYRTGDVGVLSAAACSCGRGLPVLDSIEGRSTDFVVARDGTVMHGLALIYIVRDIPGVARFKIVQESLDHTRFLLVITAEFDPGCISGIEQAARQRLGTGVRVDVEQVAEIPAEASGKFRYVISRVADQSGVQQDSRGAA
ncbi:phenylacetate--CoA ligase family protein [Seongchinamella sediminis]|uniref:Phenylacetate--CoA ligase family protein n=1 Tax=Seongchinamella sediminis TaxID=2283635 RepID=A0A3L7DW25_9GAMM|nr:AMP-binding protein [Seongchinamella sediminis]RLQ20759.1 phenylacetate--CoA ligase family protein [Seongchinamella sediminis]